MSLSQEELKQRVDFCHQMVREVEGLILEGFQKPEVSKDQKKDGSWVTEIDRRVEQVMRSMLEHQYPGERIVGEEYGVTEGTEELCWYLDPIDGTQSFVSGVPLFGTLIALVQNGETVLGYVRLPGLNETVYATRGGGAQWKPGASGEFRSCRVSDQSSFDQSLFTATSVDGFMSENRQAVYERMTSEFRVSRGWSDCYGHILVATGRAEVAADVACFDWDSAPFQVILSEAGGHFMDIQGNETPFGKSMVSVNGALFTPVQELLKEYSQ